MEVRVRKTDKGFIVTEPDGTERILPPLYYSQMIWHIKGRYFYSKEMPVDYFRKAELLRANGWETGYHFEDWYRTEIGWTEYGGMKTDNAIKQINGGNQWQM